MALAETAELAVRLKLQDELSRGVRTADTSLGGLEKRVHSVNAGLGKIGQGIRLGATRIAAIGVGVGIAAGGFLLATVKSGLDTVRQLENVEAQTRAVLKSTGNSAHVTAAQIRELSNATEDLTTIDDKTVQAGANMLLTFTKIRNEAGKGNDVYTQAVKVLADMSIATGKDMPTSAIQLGKALNDPVKGITALTRVGVTFDEQQKKQIKTLVAHGKIVEAQKIILAELNKEFGGSGAARAATYEGKIAKVKDAFEELRATLARGVLPGLLKFLDGLNRLARSPQAIRYITDLGKRIGDAMSPKNLDGAVRFARETIPTIVEGLKLGASVARPIFDAFNALPPQLKAAAVALAVGNKLTGGLVATGVGEIAKALLLGGGGKGGLVGGILGGGIAGVPRGVTPVYVTNMGAGGLGGGGIGGAAGKGGLSPLGVIGAVGGGLVVAAAWKGMFQDPQFQAQTTDIATKAQASIAKKPGRQALETQLAAVEDGIRKLSGLGPLSDLLYGGQIADLKKTADAYRAALAADMSAKASVVGPSGLPNTTPVLLREMVAQLKYIAGQGKYNVKQADATTKALLGRSQGGSVQTLTGTIERLRREQQAALARGDTKAAAAIGKDIKSLGSRLERVEASRAAMLVRARDAVVNVLRGGFAGVIGAVGGIQLPAYLGTAADLGRGPTSSRRGGTTRTPRVGIENNRPSLEVHVTTSARDTTHSQSVVRRYGPAIP